ncbi:hypothetical protein [Gimesia sp.]|uniref:hypothetical protein n=1 Tax=Gimesia sp. TaxID=2024833 RepID=UPI003A9125EA
MWLFNLKALICGFAGLAGFFIAVRFSDSRELAIIVATLSAMLFDLFLRFTNDEVENPGINPEAGGHIWFAPIWAVGILFLIIAGLAYLNVF